MPLFSRSLQSIGIITPNGAFKAAMSSSSFSGRGRNRWPRGYCDRAPAGNYGGLSGNDAFVSGGSHVSDSRGANGNRQAYNSASFQGRRAQQQQQFWHWRPLQPVPNPKSADHRNWILAASRPPRDCERFKVLSYNILADYLALDHQSTLYYHIPNYILAWEWRKRRLLFEFALWSPDIMCLQEVDRFRDLEEELAIRGYAGIWKMRTGNAIDGCAIFWRKNRFQLRHEEHIEFNKVGLRDNVAQICVLESIMRGQAENSSAALPTSCSQLNRPNQVIVCNTHVLYNPKRGEIKLGQVRVLLDRAYAVSKDWNNAPVIVCGDFNSTPTSPLYNFIATQKLNFSGFTRDQISGQCSAILHVGTNYCSSSYSVGRESAFGTQQGHFKSKPTYQHIIGNSSPFYNSTIGMHPDVQLKVDRQMPFDATAIKLGETEIFCHQGGEVSSKHLELTNLPSRTSEIFSQQRIVQNSREADKNGEEDQNVSFYGNSFSLEVQEGHGANETLSSIVDSIETTLNKPCFEDHKISPKSCDLIGEIKLSSMTCIANSTASSLHSKINFDGFLKDSDYIGNASSFHSSIDDFSTTTPCEGLYSDAIAVGNILHTDIADTFNEAKPSTSCASSEIPIVENTENSSTVMEDATLAEIMPSPELSRLEDNEDHQSLEMSDLEENADSNFFKELLGTEEEIQTMKDFNSPDMEFLKKSTFHISTALNKGSYLYNPYCWSSMEMEIASGKANCTVVEQPLKLRSVYRDVEDYTGTKDSSREPQVTSYNLQFMGTVDYIWCSEDLLTVAVLDTIPKHVMQRTRGFPTEKWGSDHIALVCELAFPGVSRKS